MSASQEALLIGAQAIADFVGLRDRRQAFHLLSTKKLPAFKLGDTWAARPSSLIAHFEKLEREQQAANP